MQTKFMSIEGLRAWMAWWVVVAHAYDIVGRGLLPSGIEKLATRSDAAVSVFMIVSGFVIAHLLLKGPVRYGDFALRRFFRIFPIYIVCLAIVLVMRAGWEDGIIQMAWPPGQVEARAERSALVTETYWTRLALHVTMLQGMVPEEVLKNITSSFLTPTWSLSLEWQFYLVAPLLFVMLRRGMIPFAITCAALLAGAFVANSGRLGHYQMPSMLLMSIHLFLIGIGSRMLLDQTRAPRLRAGAFLLLVVALMLVVRNVVALIWAVFFTFVLIENGKLQRSAWVDKLMHAIATNRVICYLGRISYSTYLIHYPIFTIARLMWPETADLSKLQMLGFLAALTPVILIASALLYRFVEQPFIHIGAQLIARRQRRTAADADKALARS
jgi:peptidoglycan/LPS O-acetylase OafA/YrhL